MKINIISKLAGFRVLPTELKTFAVLTEVGDYLRTKNGVSPCLFSGLFKSPL